MVAFKLVRTGFPRGWSWTCFACGVGGGATETVQDSRRALRQTLADVWAHLTSETADCPLAQVYTGRMEGGLA